MSDVTAAAVALLKTPFKRTDVIGGGEQRIGEFSKAENAAIEALVRKYQSKTFTRMTVEDPALQGRSYDQLRGCWKNMTKRNVGLGDLIPADAKISHTGARGRGGYRALEVNSGELRIISFPPMKGKNTGNQNSYEYRISQYLNSRGVRIGSDKVQRFLQLNNLVHGAPYLHISLLAPSASSWFWTEDETERFLEATSSGPPYNWKYVAGHVQTKSVSQCRDKQKILKRKEARNAAAAAASAAPAAPPTTAPAAPDFHVASIAVTTKTKPCFLLYPADDPNGWVSAEQIPPSCPSRTNPDLKKELASIRKRKGDAVRSGQHQVQLSEVDPAYPHSSAYGLSARKAHFLQQVKAGTSSYKTGFVAYDDLTEEQQEALESVAVAERERFEKDRREYQPSNRAYRQSDGRRKDADRSERPMMDPNLPSKPVHFSGYHKFISQGGYSGCVGFANGAEEWAKLGEQGRSVLTKEVDEEWKIYNSLMLTAFDDYKPNEFYGNDGKLREQFWTKQQRLRHKGSASMFRLSAAPRTSVSGSRVPGAPTTPRTAVNFFVQSRGITISEAAKLWNALPDEERQPFELKAEADSIRHGKEMADFRDFLYEETERFREAKKLKSLEDVTGKKRAHEEISGAKVDMQEEKNDDDIEKVAV